jgi:hypothetical protein
MSIQSGKSEGTVEVTPSGIAVYYQSAPKRLYRIARRQRTPKVAREIHEGRNIGLLEALLASAQANDSEANDLHQWIEVPSVTTVLGVLDKPALPWWGMKVGIQGVMTLCNLDLVRIFTHGQQSALVVRNETGWMVAGEDQIIELLTKHALTVNHVRDKAGSRGQVVHDALESWAQTGNLPDPSIYPPNEKGYVLGLLAFLKDVPSAEPVASEVLVASLKYGFAGRYDIRLKTTEEHRVVIHRTPKRGPKYALLAPGEYLGDLKSSKGIYSSHARQLEGYEQASIESGYEPTAGRGILHVSAEGEYEFVRSWATFEDFRAVLDVYASDVAMKERK